MCFLFSCNGLSFLFYTTPSSPSSSWYDMIIDMDGIGKLGYALCLLIKSECTLEVCCNNAECI